MWTRIAGFLVLLAGWELIGLSGLWGESFPALSTIAAAYRAPVQQAHLGRALGATAASAALGLLLGAAISLVLVLLGQRWRALHEGIDSATTTVHAIPTIAFGPVLILLAGPTWTPTVLSAMAAFFPIFVALDSALKFAPQAPQDLVAVLGATRTRALGHVHLPGALPAFIDGLRVAAPGAVIGAVLGEWFGAPRGLGVMIISSLQNVRIPQLWAAALLCVACSLLAYGVLTALHRRVQRRFAWQGG